jgi:hypothetical protein
VKCLLLMMMHELFWTIRLTGGDAISRIFNEVRRYSETTPLSDPLVWMVVTVLFAGALALAVVWPMLWTRIRLDPAAFRKKKTVSPGLAVSVRQAVTGYVRTLAETLLQGVVLLCAVVVLAMAGYLFCKMIWYLFLSTPVGQQYVAFFPHRVRLIESVLGQDLLRFPVMITGISFGAGMFFSACCRLLHLTRYAYLPRGPVGRIVLFAIPQNLVAAAAVRTVYTIPHWGAAYAGTLIPTLLVFVYCFRFTNRLLPELGLFFMLWKPKKETPLHVIFLKCMKTEKKTLEFDPLNWTLTGKQFLASDGIRTQGLFLERSGHEFILYRYGHDLFFQVDDRELALQTDLSVLWLKTGRYRRRFELYRGGDRLFRMAWSALPLLGNPAPTAAFFDTFEATLQNRAAYENAFMPEDGSETMI